MPSTTSRARSQRWYRNKKVAGCMLSNGGLNYVGCFSHLDRCWALNAGSIYRYINLGTIFCYLQSDVDALIEAISILVSSSPGGRKVSFLWRIPQAQVQYLDLKAAEALSDNLMIVNWLDDPLMVLRHPVVEACVNHGGAEILPRKLIWAIKLIFQAVIRSTRPCIMIYHNWSADRGWIR